MEAGSMSTSTDTIRTLHTRQPSPSRSPSPSPPDSPSLSASGSSVSSFPSVSSSFFFSSAAASPPHVPPLPLEGEGQLIIPELVLPAAHAVPRTPNLKEEEEEKVNGSTTRLLVLGPRAAVATALCVDNPSGWVEEEDGLSVLRAEAAWRDDDAHDKSKSQSSGTLELVSLGEDVHQLSLPTTTHRILTPFRAIGALLAPPVLSSPDREKEEKLLRGMLMGVGVPIYRALVVVSPVPTTTSGAATTAVDSGVPPSVSNSSSAATSNPPLPLPHGHPHEVDVEIPATLRALVPVVYLSLPAPKSSSRSPSSSSSSSRSPIGDESCPVEDEDPNDTTVSLDREVEVENVDGDGAPPTARLPPLPPRPRPSHAEREPTEVPVPYAPAPLPAPATSMNPNIREDTSGRNRSDTYTPSALRRILGLRAPPPSPSPSSASSSSQEAAPERGEQQGEENGQGEAQERNLRAESAALFVAWWRAGGADPYAPSLPEQLPEPAYRHLEQHERGRRRRMDEHPLHNDHWEVPRLAVHLAPQGEKSHHSPYPLHPLHSPYSSYGTNADPFHLPSLFMLVRDVARAWGSSSGGVGGTRRRRWTWGSFVAGVLMRGGRWEGRGRQLGGRGGGAGAPSLSSSGSGRAETRGMGWEGDVGGGGGVRDEGEGEWVEMGRREGNKEVGVGSSSSAVTSSSSGAGRERGKGGVRDEGGEGWEDGGGRSPRRPAGGGCGEGKGRAGWSRKGEGVCGASAVDLLAHRPPHTPHSWVLAASAPARRLPSAVLVPRLVYASHLTYPHCTAPHLPAPHRTAPHLASPHHTSPPSSRRTGTSVNIKGKREAQARVPAEYSIVRRRRRLCRLRIDVRGLGLSAITRRASIPLHRKTASRTESYFWADARPRNHWLHLPTACERGSLRLRLRARRPSSESESLVLGLGRRGSACAYAYAYATPPHPPPAARERAHPFPTHPIVEVRELAACGWVWVRGGTRMIHELRPHPSDGPSVTRARARTARDVHLGGAGDGEGAELLMIIDNDHDHSFHSILFYSKPYVAGEPEALAGNTFELTTIALLNPNPNRSCFKDETLKPQRVEISRKLGATRNISMEPTSAQTSGRSGYHDVDPWSQLKGQRKCQCADDVLGTIANSGRNEIYHFGLQTETARENLSDIQPWGAIHASRAQRSGRKIWIGVCESPARESVARACESSETLPGVLISASTCASRTAHREDLEPRNRHPTPSNIPLNSASSLCLSVEESTGGASSARMVRKGVRMRRVVVGRESWIWVWICHTRRHPATRSRRAGHRACYPRQPTHSAAATAARGPRISRRVIGPFAFSSSFSFSVFGIRGISTAGNPNSGIISCPWVSSSGGTCGGDAAAELKKKGLDTEGKEDADEPEVGRDGLSGGDGVGERDGEGWRVWRVRIVSALVLIDPASIAVGDSDKMAVAWEWRD
ncbi:hypothetical protein B0H13DRAFT_2527439 [Mycena leptocephala]|nr:hypothetical protein B0H13DRAFT_2527439 [Mycena leptocephala]